MHRHRPRRGWTRGVPIGERGPGESYRPEDVAPSVFGAHQPGIATPVLDHLAFAALDLSCAGKPELAGLLRELTAEAERLMRAEHRAPSQGRPAGSLTLTLGFGPDLFDERFDLASRRPVALAALPAFAGDTLDPPSSGGDLGVQVCASTAATADQALARLIAIDRRALRVRWSQRVAMRRLASERPDGRPRNLLGFKEATANPRRGKDLARHVWIGGRERTWMLGGTFLVVRKVRVLLEDWNALSLAQQERVIGRHRDSGASLGRTHEFEPMPLDRDDIVPPDAHARLANPRANGGLTVLRPATATTTVSTQTAEPTPASCCCSTDAIPAASSSRSNAAWLNATPWRPSLAPSPARSSRSRPARTPGSHWLISSSTREPAARVLFARRSGSRSAYDVSRVTWSQ